MIGNIFKKYFGLGIVVTINLALQFLFQWYVIIYFGAGSESDVFFGTMALPQFILLVLSGSLTLVLVPIFAGLKNADFKREAWGIFQLVGFVFFCLSIILLITVNWWVKLLLPGFSGETYELAVQLSSIQLLAMLFSAMLSVLWTLQNAKENFYQIELTSIAAAAISFIVFYFSLDHLGVYAAAWVNVLRILLQLVFLGHISGPTSLSG